MSRAPQNLPMHLRPINRLIQLLIQPPHHRYTISPHNIQPQRYFFAGNLFFARPDDALDRFLEDQVHAAVAGEERADHGASVECEDCYAFWGGS